MSTKTKSTSDELTDKELLTKALETTEEAVLRSFAELPRAYKPSGLPYVYVPGTLKEKILFVAHADTVNGSGLTKVPTVRWLGDACLRSDAALFGTSGTRFNSGSLGADDRAGCAALWRLRATGHSLLVTTGEEVGCVGAKAAAAQISQELGSHLFALEIDRRGDRQAVFYSVSTPEFEEYIITLLSAHDKEGVKWAKQNGSSSDIAHLCSEIGICGVNVSAGYAQEHTSDELLFLPAWRNTVNAVMALAADKQKLLRHTLPRRRLSSASSLTSPRTSTDYQAERNAKGAIKVYESKSTTQVYVWFQRPNSGIKLSRKRYKRLLKKIEHYHQRKLISTDKTVSLCEEVIAFYRRQEENLNPALPTTAVALSARQIRETKCECVQHCISLPLIDRHNRGCCCAKCAPYMHRATGGSMGLRTGVKAEDKGKVLCWHRCPVKGCDGLDGSGSWYHVKQGSNAACPHGQHWDALCPIHTQPHPIH